MNLQDRLMDDLKESMRKRDEMRCSVIRMVRAAIKNAEIEKQATLEDPDVLGVIAKDVKRHQESISEFKKGNRQDLVDREEAELKVLLEYLPEQMSREEVVEEARRVIAEVEAQGAKDKGKVMSRIMPELRGKADGHLVNEVVSELLAG